MIQKLRQTFIFSFCFHIFIIKSMHVSVYFLESRLKFARMCCNYSRKKLAIISGIYLIFRNFSMLAISWTIFYFRRNELNEIWYILSRCLDSYCIISFVGVCLLFNGIEFVSPSDNLWKNVCQILLYLLIMRQNLA